MKHLLTAFMLMLIGGGLSAQLSAGDIALLQYNADGDEIIKFLALTDIAETEQLFFTDNGWFASGSFRASEGTYTWDAPVGGVACGTVVTVDLTGPALSGSGDQLIVYQGTEGSPTIITALNAEGAGVWQADATSAGTSALPAGLVNGTNAVALVEIDNAIYTGTLTGSKADLRTAIHNNTNWAGSNTVIQDFTGVFTVSDCASGPAVIRLIEADPIADRITVKNFGGTAVDISSYFFCSLFSYGQLSGYTVESGSLNLDPDAEVVISGFALVDAAADLGLYNSNADYNNPSNMDDWMQWGAGGQGRESVAVTKGIWSAGEFVDGSGTYRYIGDGTENGRAFWDDTRLDYFNLQFPGSGTIEPLGGLDVYAQAYEPNLTDVTSGAAPGIECWIGVSSTNSDPSTWAEGDFTVAPFFSEEGGNNNDQFFLTIGTGMSPGTYYYASRFRYNEGPFMYGGIDGGGAGNEWDGTTYNSGVLTINSPELDYNNLQSPPSATILEGSTMDAYARAYEAGLTDVTSGQAPGIEVWLGVNAANSDPSTWLEADWTVATFNLEVGNDDEYIGTFGSSLAVGTFYYASRFRLNGGAFTYGGYNGSGGGTWDGTGNVSGVLTVDPVPVPNLVITEIVYNTSGTDDEWIEICNNEGADVDISGYEVLDASSVRFTFPASTTLTAGTCITVSLGSNGDGTYNLDCPFTPDYGVDAVTNSTNVLSNTAETITLRIGGGTVVDVVSYDDGDGADDNGNSLHVTDINADNSVTNSNWQEVTLGGSPGNNSLISNCAPTNTFVQFAQSTINLNEEDSVFTVCLSILNPDPVEFTDALIAINPVSSAVSPDDYAEDNTFATPFMEFGFSKDYAFWNGGESADICFELFLNDDLLDEGQETIVLRLLNDNVSGGDMAEVGADSTLTIIIADNDAPVVLPCTDLFISEYIEGGSNNKCIEIYNPSAVEVDMAAEGYALYRYGNGASTPSDTLMLQGTLCPGAVYVACNGSSAASFLAQADTTHSISFFNGDDAIQLVKGAVHGTSFGTSLDVIGQIGVDPGSAWTGTGCSTANNTLVRKSTIQMGDADGSNAFDPSLEWDCFAQDTDTELGGHVSDCFAPAACSLTVADGGNQSTCDSGTNTYSNDVLLTYSGDPGCGVIFVNGQEFAIGTSPQTVTLTGLTADGLPVDLSAEFSADATCSASAVAAFTAPDNCLPVNMIVINEVDYDQPESGDPAEFIELYNAGASAVDLDAYEVRLINGSGGSVYSTFDLPSVMLAAGDYYVLGSATVPNVDQIVFSGNNFQNGAPDGVELVFTGTQVDALSYEGDIAGIVETAGAPSDPGGSSATGLSRITDGTDTDDNSADFVVTCITPGEANVICAVNDDCADALNLSSSVWGEPGWTMHELGQQESLPGCSGDADDDIWFTFQASSANDVIIARDPSGTYNAVIEVFETCGGVSLGCFDNYPAGQIERALPGGLIAGTTYRFRVYDDATGASASTNVEVAVKTYEDGGLESSYCDVIDYDLSQSIYAERDALGELYSNPAVPVKGYSFRFQEQGGGLDVVYTHPNFTPYVSLGNVGGLEYGKTYDVSVSHKVKLTANGSVMEYWSDFGTSCPITLVATPPSTQVQDIYCSSADDFFLADIIKADQVPGATQYRFTFVGGGDTFVETTNSYGIFLYNVGSAGNGLLYSTVYSVSVEVNVNGTWSAPGAACSIALSTQPESTALQGTYCGGTYEYPQNPNYLLAESVLGADYYEWRFTPVGGGVAQTDVTSGISLAMHLTSLDLSAGGDWDVEVRASAGGVLGDYGSLCSVTINAAAPMAPPSDETAEVKTNSLSELSMNIYPNPNDGNQFRLNVEGLSGKEGTLTIEVMDMTGKVVFTEVETVKGESVNLIVQPDGQLSPGAYLLRLFSESVITTQSLIIR